MRRFFDVLNVLLAGGLVWYTAWAWPRLPREIPAHFALDGRADRWTATTAASWFTIPAIAVGSLVVLWLLREWAVRRPGALNLPGGKKLEDYDPKLRPGILEHMRLVMAIVSTEVVAIFALIQVGSFRTASGGSGEGVVLAVLAIAMLSSPILLVVYFLGFQRVTRSPPE